jgi:hypothetical protein
MPVTTRKLLGLALLQLTVTGCLVAQQNNCPGTSKPCPPSQSQNNLPAPAPPPQSATIWNIPANTRQTLLADQIRQAQQTQQLSADLRSQIQAAYASQKQSQLAAQQAAVNQVAAQQQAAASIQGASQAAMNAGFEQGAGAAQARVMPKRVDMVVAAAKDWTPPKQYSAANSASVALDDPFSTPHPAAVSDPLAPLRTALNESCLRVDEEHGVAQVQKECRAGGENLPLQLGDYPVLADGSLLDSPERVKTFVDACNTPHAALYALRGGAEMIVLKR